MKFTPVLELEPYNFSDPHRESPDCSAAENPVAWYTFWKTAMQEAGMQLEPVVLGSYFVAVNGIDDASLRIILQHELNERYAAGAEMSAMIGGYALQVPEVPLEILPQCCGDLSNITEWTDAVTYIGDAKKELWIGHPWILAYGDEKVMTIELTTEYGSLPDPYIFQLDRKQLASCIKNAKVELRQFRQRIQPIVEEIIGVSDAGRVSDMLIAGGSGIEKVL